MIQKITTKYYLLLLLLVLFASCKQKRDTKPRVLLFSKTAGFHHDSIEKGKVAILKLAQENNFDLDTTSNADWFNEDSLKNYSAVIFLNTTGDLLNHYQEADFERYIQAGGGFVGVHGAADAEFDWGWYGRLVGGYFLTHPEVKEGALTVVNKNHPSTEFLPNPWIHKDEWYAFKKLNKDINVLFTIDKNVYDNPNEMTESPMAWYHDYDGGRAFYTGLGHRDEDYEDPLFLKHLLGGIQYAIGENYELNYDKVKSKRVPEEERFTKVPLAIGEFSEPTEMAILPNLDILVAQRRGELLLYNQETQKVEQVGLLDVYCKTDIPNVSAEEGFMGLTLDPDFKDNNFIYAFYSPKDTSVNRLSRFVFKDNKLDMQSEKVVLEFFSQRQICCHTGGSLAFGKDRQLYLSTGDNSTPFDEKGQQYVSNGFAPIDDRPGHAQYDAARTAGNTNDLRGKILRIKVNKDGTYDIPKGNLFAKNEEGTRPEIYVMGNRNPYRISIDKETGFLYWGEVGPDAGDDKEGRGPRGYDELNQARQAGFFGWPFFVGNNYAYHGYNYETGETSTPFEPKGAVNNSRNNTGLKTLPPVQPTFIWYPYANSADFPQVGSGGRNAMAGPVYYSKLAAKENRYSDYYDGKLFMYDWIRGWIKVVTMLPNGDFDKMEPFMPNTSLAGPIDMELGPDGKIYILEYGNGWFSKNPDAALSRIDYNNGELASKSQKQGVIVQKDPEGTVYKDLDKADGSLGHKEGSVVSEGEALVMGSDCKSCHTLSTKSVGPNYKDIAKKYKDNKDAQSILAKKIIKGGSGVWGEVAMPAHPSLTEKEVNEMIKWILTL